MNWEKRQALQGRPLDAFVQWVGKISARASAVVIEDYSKGVVQQPVLDAVLKVAGRRGIPVGLDPKDNYELKVRGITLAKPNRRALPCRPEGSRRERTPVAG